MNRFLRCLASLCHFLAQFWLNFGSVLAQSWFSFGLVQFWCSLVQFWCSLVQFWFSLGSVLVQVWFSFGSVLVQGEADEVPADALSSNSDAPWKGEFVVLGNGNIRLPWVGMTLAQSVQTRFQT